MTFLPEAQGMAAAANSTAPWWAIPAATLLGAALAATVLLLNEHLKSKREDRRAAVAESIASQRQWDREIRDHCAQTLVLAKQVTELRRALTMNLDDEGQPRPYRQPEEGERNAAHHREVLHVRHELDSVSEQLRLIAPPDTLTAHVEVVESVAAISNHLHDGFAGKAQFRRVSVATDALVATVKRDLRLI